MLKWILIFFVAALIAAALGFGGVAASLAWVAEILFYAFVALFVVTLVAHLFRSPPRVT